MTDQASFEKDSTTLVRDHAKQLLAKNPEMTREQLRSELAHTFLTHTAEGAFLSGPAQAGAIYTGLPTLAGLRLVLRSLCWVFRRDKSDVEDIKSAIDEIVTELMIVR